MKKFFVCFALFIAALFVVSCGGSDGSNNSREGSSRTAICSYGEYECHGNDSYFCGYSGDDLMWLLSENCTNDCDDSTGKCSLNSNAACTTQGAFRCNGNIRQKCDQEVWKPYENCADSGKTCNAETGKCESGKNGDGQTTMECGNKITEIGEACDGDAKECSSISSAYTGGYAVCNSDCSGYNTSDCKTDNGGGTSSGSDSCSEIYDCYAQCETDSCAQACYDNGSSYGQGQFMDMYNCWVQYCSNSSTNDDFTNCVYNYCYDETDACINLNGGGSGGGGSASECTSGQYTCSGSYSYYCSGGYWDSGSYCSNGCDSSTGKCKSSSGGGGNGGGGSSNNNPPCPPQVSVSGTSSVKLSWSVTASGTSCGNATSYTVKRTNSVTGEAEVLKENTSSTSYTDSKPYPGKNSYGIIAHNNYGDSVGYGVSDSIGIKAPNVVSMTPSSSGLTVVVKDLDYTDSVKSAFQLLLCQATSYSDANNNNYCGTGKAWYYSEGSGSSQRTFYVDFGVNLSGQTYYYKVRWDFKPNSYTYEIGDYSTPKSVKH